MRTLALAGLIVISAAALAFVMRPAALEVATAVVDRGAIRVSVNEDGRARVRDRYVISTPMSGSIARLEWRAGDEVTDGRSLARLSPTPAPLLDNRARAEARAQLAAAEASVRQAQAIESQTRSALEQATRELDRITPLAQSGTVSQAELDAAAAARSSSREQRASAGFAVRVAQHQAELARVALSLSEGSASAGADDAAGLEITSPIDGAVLEVFRQSEGVVPTGERLLELGDPSALELVIDVLSEDAVRIQPGARATVTRWGGDAELDARVMRVEPKAFARVSSLGVEEQRVNVVLELLTERAQWARLGDGYRVEVRIMVEERDDAVRVPISAIFRRDDRWAVYAIEDGVAQVRTLTLGAQDGDWAEVLEGLQPGAQVVLHAGERVTAGTRVRPADTAPPTLDAVP